MKAAVMHVEDNPPSTDGSRPGNQGKSCTQYARHSPEQLPSALLIGEMALSCWMRSPSSRTQSIKPDDERILTGPPG